MPLVAPVAAAASGDNTVVAAVAAKWRSGTTDVTGLLYFAAAGASVDSAKSGEQNDFLFETVAGQALVANLSAAVPVGGFVNYTLE
jgi:hypothetical protein